MREQAVSAARATFEKRPTIATSERAPEALQRDANLCCKPVSAESALLKDDAKTMRPRSVGLAYERLNQQDRAYAATPAISFTRPRPLKAGRANAVMSL